MIYKDFNKRILILISMSLLSGQNALTTCWTDGVRGVFFCFRTSVIHLVFHRGGG